MKQALLLTCEHADNRVPARYREALRGAGRALRTHRGFDPGAHELARRLARALDAPLLACTTTRLLIDPNRSAGHPRRFSEWTRELPPDERARIAARYWEPHRREVEAWARARLTRGEHALHLSIHSFTPIWKGRRRDVDVGFLFDPRSRGERRLADAWLEALRTLEPRLRLRRNRPYRGDGDGLTTDLRQALGMRRYTGLELELNQRFPRGAPARWRRLQASLVESLRTALAATRPPRPRGARPRR